MWTAKVITLFPEVFPGVLGSSLVGKSLGKSWNLETVDLREFGAGVHRSVDDTPIGGGPGMVIKPDILASALQSTQDTIDEKPDSWPVVFLSPRGKLFDQSTAKKWSTCKGITLICGRYEGVDERFFQATGAEEISMGDFVLSGGEIAAQALIEATVRLIPNVLGNFESTENESFICGLLEHPHYTRPRVWNGLSVPEILLTGHHENIAQWRKSKAEELTKLRRPDLWQKYCEQKAETNI
ncbi:MAG: tRNA (guanosine(37)-N1)-methyltransferase TrmD [Paracoccaceae bacterium]|nr:tRNA (guanosine(37)-N1)-methyltransferase TrmD [Paracoccaceae bacterium]